MPGFGDMLNLMRGLGDLQAKLQSVQDDLGRRVAEGSAGGGLVTAKVNGRMELLEVHIDPEALRGEDADLLEDLVQAAVGQALEKAKALQREGMTRLLGGLPLPPGVETLLGL